MVAQGSGKEVGTVLEVKCTYKTCQQRFVSVEEMRRHKKYAPEHDYCKKCDVDCADWEALTQHKVSMMDDFFRHRHSLGKDAQPQHITCEFCGEDFKSFGGRKGHRAQMHPADQEIRCSGCKALFTRAGNMVAHLEQGDCPEITLYEFRASIQHKMIRKAMLKDLDEFGARICSNNAFLASVAKPGLVTDGTEMEDQEEGGVNLLDQEHDEQKTGYEALQPEVDLMGMESLYSRPAHEAWPRLPGLQTSKLTDSMRNMSIGLNTSSFDSPQTPMSDVTSRRGGLRVRTESLQTESWPSLNNSPAAGSVDEDDDVASGITAVTSRKPTVWTTGKTSKALFQSAKAMTRPGDWAMMSKRKEEEALADNSTNLWYSRFYDPSSDDYIADRFFNTMLEKYCCPFAECDINECQYDVLSELEVHMHHRHLSILHVCPTCKKRYTSAAAQVSHMESAGKCRIKDSKKFGEVLDDVTGGFLTGKRVNEPFVYKAQQALVKAGRQALNGVAMVEYEAKLPHEK